MTARDTLNAAMTEADFTTRVINRLKARGWKVHHSRPAINQSGKWSTPLQGHRGLPDIVAAHPTRGVLFAELKTAKGTVTPDQQEWLRALGGDHHTTHPLEDGRSLIVAVWRPADWPTITRIIDGDTP